MSPSIFAESFIREKERREIYQTITFLHALVRLILHQSINKYLLDLLEETT